MDFSILTLQERLFHAHPLYQDIRTVSMTAPRGHVLEQAETAAVNAMRNLTKSFSKSDSKTASPTTKHLPTVRNALQNSGVVK